MMKTASDILKELSASHGSPPIIGGVAVHNLIASGGMGAVFRGVHLRLRIPVAIKFLFDTDDAIASRFAEEASVAAKINNPNVVRVYDVNKEKSLQYIVQEFVEGHTAEHHLANAVSTRQPLAENFVLNMAADIARGLIAIHNVNYLHLDIKPTNIMVSQRNGVSKILDLGLAQRLDGTNPPTSGKEVRSTRAEGGTPGYASPEQLKFLQVSVTSDIYSLGVTMFELLAGRRAHDAVSWNSAVLQQSTIELPNICRLRADVSEETGALIERCVAIDPAARFQTPLEMLSKIAEQNRGQVSQRKPGTIMLPPNPSKGHRIGRPVIHCIDDDATIGALLKELLTEAGYCAETFTDGKFALNAMQLSPPDIVVVDYDMPIMSGLDVCRAMRSNDILKHIPVVFLTGAASATNMTLAMREGATDYIFKPVQAEELFARLNCLTRLARAQRELEALESQYGSFRKRLTTIVGKDIA